MDHREFVSNCTWAFLRCSFFLKRVAAAVLLFMLSQVQAGAQAKSCPLTDAQTQKAVDAWAKIAAFLTTEPRCVNCHGKVNPYIEGIGLDPDDPFKDPEAPISQIEHGGGKQKHENTGIMDQGCKKCHDGMAPKRDGSPSVNWTLAPNFLSFVDKDPTTLCRQIKRATGSADGFIGHLKDDNGQTNFAGTGFLGNRGLGDDSLEGFNVTIEKPSITHDALMQMGQDWINAMGGAFQGDDGCGCEFRHSLWSGQIHYTKVYTGDQGHNELQEWSQQAQTTVTITAKNGLGIYHGHVAEKGTRDNRQRALRGGSITYIKDTSDSGETSGDGTYPASIDVSVDEAGTYSIQAGIIAPDGRPTWPSKIGETHWTQCIRSDCKSGTSNIGMPSIELMGPLSGKTKDPNHIQASQYDRKENLGYGKNGVMIQTITVDLWRSGSK